MIGTWAGYNVDVPPSTLHMATPPLPSKARVREDVTRFVAGFARVRPDQVRPTSELAKAPLKFDDESLKWLAMSLRGYVHHYNPAQSVLASDTRKGKLTVDGLADLVYTKIHA